MKDESKELNFSNIDYKDRINICNKYLNCPYREGYNYRDFPHNYTFSRDKVKRYIKRNKYDVAEKIISDGNLNRLKNFLKIFNHISIEEYNAYLKFKTDNIEIKAYLLEKMHRSYSEEEIQNVQESKIEKELGIKKYTLSDIKKIFTISKNGEEYTINKYKGADENVYIPSIINNGKITKIKSRAFDNNKKIKTVILEEGFTEIEEYAFSRCEKLENIVLPSSLISIGKGAFSYCTNLGSVYLSEGLKELNDYAFFNCEKLSSFNLPESLTIIGDNLLFGCKNYMGSNGAYVYNNYFFGSNKDYDEIPLEILPSTIIKSKDGYLPYLFFIKESEDRYELPKAISLTDKVKFGFFPQDKDGTMRPIEWSVVGFEHGGAILLADKVLYTDFFDYEYDCLWEDSYARNWCNNIFYNLAFNENEKEKIIEVNNENKREDDTKDNVFLLSCKQYKKYIFNKTVINTDYPIYDDRYEDGWWLRDRDYRSYDSQIAVCTLSYDLEGMEVIGESYKLKYRTPGNHVYGYRPAICVKCERIDTLKPKSNKNKVKPSTSNTKKYVIVQFENNRKYTYFTYDDVELNDKVTVSGKLIDKVGTIVDILYSIDNPKLETYLQEAKKLENNV